MKFKAILSTITILAGDNFECKRHLFWIFFAASKDGQHNPE